MRRLLAFGVLAFLAAGSASARPLDAPLTVTSLVLTGHGWGHGVGMAQWGAYGYAKAGSTYDQILAHYYPSTQLSTAPPTALRILLATGTQLTVASTADFAVRDATGALQTVPAGSYTLDSTLTLPGLPQLQAPLLFRPGTAPLSLGGVAYRGSLEVGSDSTKLSAVNLVGLEAYVRGVVSQELPKTWPLEALKAQAVAARSYALAERRGGAFDLYAETRDQAYGGIAAETPATNQAVDATKGQVLLYGGTVATTYFSSSSGGETAAVSEAFPQQKQVPYLVSVQDPYDTMSPWHDWGPVVVDASRISRQLRVPGVSDLLPAPAVGHAKTVSVVGSSGTVTLPATTVRAALGLRSTWFEAGVLSLTRPAGTVLRGATVTLTGVARRVSLVALEQRTALGVWEAGPPIEPDAGGSFTVDVRPQGTTLYRLVADGVRSLPLRVPVAGS